MNLLLSNRRLRWRLAGACRALRAGALFCWALGCAVFFPGVVRAQTPNEGLMLRSGSSSGAFQLSWWGRAGRNYFVQSSEDLASWAYEPVLELGSDQVIAWGFQSPVGKRFLRLKTSGILPESGYYETAFNISFEAGTDGNSRAHFTLDGSEPSVDSPEWVETEYSVGSRTRLKVRYFINGIAVGGIQGGDYLIQGKTVLAGGNSTVALADSGTTWKWGVVADLGTSDLSGVNEMRIGADQCLAYRGDGPIQAWGGNDCGQLGNGTRIGSLNPGVVTQLGTARTLGLAAGDGFSVALTEAGDVYAWGDGSCGQLGVGGSMQWTLVPVKVPGLPRIQKIVAGRSTVYAIDEQGRLWVWGDNSYSQAGPGERCRLSVPILVAGIGEPVIAVSAGTAHALVLTKSGTVYSWGSNWYGQLGRRGPEPMGEVDFGEGAPAIVLIAAGEYHNLALAEDGVVYGWGAGWSGQNGNCGYVDQSRPQLIACNILEIAAGRAHSVALGKDGAVYAWGDNSHGQLGILAASTAFPQDTGVRLFELKR